MAAGPRASSKHFVVAAFVAAAIPACATAPPPQKPTRPAAPAALYLCSGGGIANAPAADPDGRILGFAPTIDIRGVRLARAPVKACVSSGFGPRNGGASSFHKGVDLLTKTPAPVRAGGDGVVEKIGAQNGYGLTILIRHGAGVKTLYAHLSSFAPALREGADVRLGEVIGQSGKTGNATAVHLHYEVIIDGDRVNPLTVGR